MLIWTSSLLYTIRDFWMVCHAEYDLDRNKVPHWIFNMSICADNFFWLQNWVYVSLYLRVAFLVPLTFCFQSDQVKAKRKRYKCTL